jgi:glucokinase
MIFVQTAWVSLLRRTKNKVENKIRSIRSFWFIWIIYLRIWIKKRGKIQLGCFVLALDFLYKEFFFYLCMKKKYVIGVDIGATNLRVAISDEKGVFLKELIERTDKRSSKAFIKQLICLINQVAKKSKVNFEEIKGIGIGSVGPIDASKGEISPTNLPIKNIPLIKKISSSFDLPIYLLNDCNAGALGEKWFGDAKNLDNFVYLTLSTGIGAGAYVDNKLLIGKDGNACEVGHLVIDFEGRLKCGCGKRGHWEAYCSGKNIPNFVRYWAKRKELEREDSPIVEAALSKKLTSKQLFDSAKKGDKLALEIVEEIGRLNAMGIANIINAYDPSLITLGGGLALNNEELILKPIKRWVGAYSRNRLPTIKLTPLKEKVVLYGAIARAFQNE